LREQLPKNTGRLLVCAAGSPEQRHRLEKVALNSGRENWPEN